MTELNLFVNQLRYYILGLEAEDSLLAEMELGEVGQASLPPNDSLLSALNTHYHGDENYRRAYLTREPSPGERLAAELREWLALILPPLDGELELSRAWAMAPAPQESDMDEEEELSGSSLEDTSEIETSSKVAEVIGPLTMFRAKTMLLRNFTIFHNSPLREAISVFVIAKPQTLFC